MCRLLPTSLLATPGQVGNGQGVGYFGLGKAPTVRLAIGRAQRRALRRVHFYPFYDNRTIYANSQVSREGGSCLDYLVSLAQAILLSWSFPCVVQAKFKRTIVNIQPALPGHGIHIHPKVGKLLGSSDCFALFCFVSPPDLFFFCFCLVLGPAPLHLPASWRPGPPIQGARRPQHR